MQPQLFCSHLRFCDLLKLLKIKNQATPSAGYGDRFGLGFFLVLVWQELAVYFGLLLKGAWAVRLDRKRVSTSGTASLAPDCGPRSGSLAPDGEE